MDKIPEGIVTVLAVFGSFAIVLTVVLILVVILSAISDFVRRLKYKHKIKHRFDKPPLAKCYCIDCEHHMTNNRCLVHDGWYVADNWFCWDASPRKRDEENSK